MTAMPFTEPLLFLAEDVLRACHRAELRLAVAESCTGGMITALLTAVPGSSDVLERGFVTYANEAKVDMLGVPEAILAEHGAVSEQTARAMAEGALGHSHADIAAAVTGIAGPGGATAKKPVGLVHMAAARKGGPTVHEEKVFSGDRDQVRLQAVEAVLRLLKTLAV
jgi:nicotinamide-nucleotide amidase